MAARSAAGEIVVPAAERQERTGLEARQLERLRALVDAIVSRNPFYTAKLGAADVAAADLRTLTDVRRLPLTTKAELAADQDAHPPWGTNLTEPIERYTRYCQTSSTTGRPLKWCDTNDSWQWMLECWKAVYRAAGVGTGDRVLFPFSFGPFLGFWTAFDAAHQIDVLAVPAGGMSSQLRLAMIDAVRTTVICCTPTYALRLAEVARETGFDLSTIPMKATVHAGEPGANVPATKARIQDVWSAKCFDHAGATEVGAHSFECQAQPGGTHLIESEYIAEILDPASGKPVAEGEKGELVITNLGRWGFPIIRYKTGDIVRTTTRRCDCGRTSLRFEGGIIGRADDMVTVRGVNVFPAGVENILRKFAEVDEFRITVNKVRQMDEMDVEVELCEGADPNVVHAIAERLDSMLSFRPRVHHLPRNALPRFELKAKRFHVQR